MWCTSKLIISVLYLQYFQLILSHQETDNSNYSKQHNSTSIKQFIGKYNHYSNLGNDRLRHRQFPSLESPLDWIQPKLRHHGHNMKTTTTTTTTTPSPLFETYGDLEEDKEEYDDTLEYYDDDDTDNSQDISTKGPIFEDPDDEYINFQSDTSIPAPQPVSKLTKYKWEHFGSISSVRESRNKQLNIHPSREETKVSAAREHFLRVNTDGLCKKPLPKVIPIQNEHPNRTLIYSPHCTVLHRCAEDTGCCKQDTVCRYKSRTLVYLHFYTQVLGTSSAVVKVLPFYNHTECECQKKNYVNSYTSPPIIKTGVNTRSGIAYRSANSVADDFDSRCKCTGQSPGSKCYCDCDESTEDCMRRKRVMVFGGFREQLCKCPRQFIPGREGRKCYCDCEESNEDCMMMKRGMEHIGLTDRLCVLNSQCGTLRCQYGSYIREIGRCPRESEKLGYGG